MQEKLEKWLMKETSVYFHLPRAKYKDTLHWGTTSVMDWYTLDIHVLYSLSNVLSQLCCCDQYKSSNISEFTYIISAQDFYHLAEFGQF